MINYGGSAPFSFYSMSNFALEFIRIVLIVILVVSAAISVVIMSPFFLVLWWIRANKESRWN